MSPRKHLENIPAGITREAHSLATMFAYDIIDARKSGLPEKDVHQAIEIIIAQAILRKTDVLEKLRVAGGFVSAIDAALKHEQGESK